MISEKVNFIAIPRTGTNSIRALIPYENDGYSNHASIRKTKDERFSFAVIRHPLQRLMSWWKYHKYPQYDEFAHIYGSSFRDWAYNGFQHHWTPDYLEHRMVSSPLRQCDFICNEDGEIIVDRLINYDALQQQFTQALRPYMHETRLPKINPSPSNITISLSPQILKLTQVIFQRDWEIYNSLQPR
jgi:hypothetical protein